LPTKTAGQGQPGYATTDANGHYQLSTLQGAVDAGTTPGEYLVTISKVVPGDAPAAPGFSPPPKHLIPVRYGQTGTSGLTATVENKRSNEINFDLTKD